MCVDMKKVFVLFFCLLLLAGCQSAEKKAEAVPSAKTSAPPAEASIISFAGEIAAADVEKILYFDDSQPPNTPGYKYSATPEIEKILQMMQKIRLTMELPADGLSSAAPGDFGGYEIYLKNGDTHRVWRSGSTLTVDGRPYAYTGRLARQLYRDEVIISADCSAGMPGDGRISLHISAFDEKNIKIVDAPVLKKMTGFKWVKVQPSKKYSGQAIPVAEYPQYIDLDNYPGAACGDYKMLFQAVLPDGSKKEILVPFTIFEK
jgi:hypothetical protein